MQKGRLTGTCGKTIQSLRSTTLLAATFFLVSCAAKPVPQAVYVPPAAPVGHVYPVAITVPPPVSPRIKFSAAQTEQAQQAFNVIGLKSALMVAALSCNEQDKYDVFMTSFQPHILAEQHVMDAYFYKASGPYSGKAMEDTFTTLLANNQSDNGIHEGSLFCLNNAAEFNAVLALKTPADLDHFVTDQAPPATPAFASLDTH